MQQALLYIYFRWRRRGLWRNLPRGCVPSATSSTLYILQVVEKRTVKEPTKRMCTQCNKLYSTYIYFRWWRRWLWRNLPRGCVPSATSSTLYVLQVVEKRTVKEPTKKMCTQCNKLYSIYTSGGGEEDCEGTYQEVVHPMQQALLQPRAARQDCAWGT